MDGQEPFPLEECRAECVSLHLGTAPDVQGIFGFVGEAEAESLFAPLGTVGIVALLVDPSPWSSPSRRDWVASNGISLR